MKSLQECLNESISTGDLDAGLSSITAALTDLGFEESDDVREVLAPSTGAKFFYDTAEHTIYFSYNGNPYSIKYGNGSWGIFKPARTGSHEIPVSGDSNTTRFIKKRLPGFIAGLA